MQCIGKTVLVTGGGSGIGRATALAFAQAGAMVFVANRDLERGQATVTLIEHAGGMACFVPTDVSEPHSVTALIRQIQRTTGRLEIAFNNAGLFGPVAPLAQQRLDDYDALFAANVRGTLLCMQAELTMMLGQGGGVIINNASSTGLRNNTHGVALYAAAKSAVISLTRSAAMEYASHGIRVNAVAPGRVRTDMLAQAAGGNPERFAAVVPMGRLGTPEEVAAAVVWLASDAASFVTGQVLGVDGGFLAS